MGQFQLLDLAGRFYLEAGVLHCERVGCEQVAVPPLLEPLRDQQVKLLLCYTPDIASLSPGHGSCLYGRNGDKFCPVHRQDHRLLLRFFSEGLLTEVGGQWRIGNAEVPLQQMPGHRGRLLGVTLIEEDEIRRASADGLLEDLAAYQKGMRAVLDQLQLWRER